MLNVFLRPGGFLSIQNMLNSLLAWISTQQVNQVLSINKKIIIPQTKLLFSVIVIVWEEHQSSNSLWEFVHSLNLCSCLLFANFHLARFFPFFKISNFLSSLSFHRCNDRVVFFLIQVENHSSDKPSSCLWKSICAYSSINLAMKIFHQIWTVCVLLHLTVKGNW